MEDIMSKEKLWGWIATIITMVYTLIGMPSQIWQNYVNQSVAGLSLNMYAIMSVMCVCWAVYATVKKDRDWFIIIPNSLGAVCALIILSQFYFY